MDINDHNNKDKMPMLSKYVHRALHAGVCFPFSDTVPHISMLDADHLDLGITNAF